MSRYGDRLKRRTSENQFLANIADTPVSVGGTILSGQNLAAGRAMVRANASSPFVVYTTSVSLSGENVIAGFLTHYAVNDGSGIPLRSASGEMEVSVLIKGSVRESKVDFGTGTSAVFKDKNVRITYL